MSSFLPSSPAVQPSPRQSVLLRESLHALCPAGLQSSKVEVLQEKSRSLVRTTSIMLGQWYPQFVNGVLCRLSAVSCVVLSCSADAASSDLVCYEMIPCSSDDLWGTHSLFLSFIHTVALNIHTLFSLAVCLSNIAPQLPGESASLDGEWRSRSDVSALSRCLTWSCLPLLGPFYHPTTTHSQPSLGWRGGEEVGSCLSNSCIFQNTRTCTGSSVSALADTQTCMQSYSVSRALMIWWVARCRVRILRTLWTAMCN